MDVNGNISLEYGGTALDMRTVGNQLMFLGQHDDTLDVEPRGTCSSYPTKQVGKSQISSPVVRGFAADFTLIGSTVFFSA